VTGGGIKESGNQEKPDSLTIRTIGELKVTEQLDLDHGPLERMFFEGDVRRRLQIAQDVGQAIARQSPDVPTEDVEAFYRGYTKAIEIVRRILLGS
jgi:hypothetical protein